MMMIMIIIIMLIIIIIIIIMSLYDCYVNMTLHSYTVARALDIS